MTTIYPVIDVETTGLDPDRDQLLEVACIILDENLEEVGTWADSVRYTEPHVNLMKLECHPVVLEMHEENGLWDELPLGVPRDVVDRSLQEFLLWHSKGEKPAMVGNSNRLDLNFLQRHLPLSYGTLHYRSIDLTSIDLALQAAGRPSTKTEGAGPSHRALSDCWAAVGQFRNQMEVLRAL